MENIETRHDVSIGSRLGVSIRFSSDRLENRCSCMCCRKYNIMHLRVEAFFHLARFAERDAESSSAKIALNKNASVHP